MIDHNTKCNQAGCESLSIVRYTWPGKDEAGACLAHSMKLRQMADAMGLPLQIIPLVIPDDTDDYIDDDRPANNEAY